MRVGIDGPVTVGIDIGATKILIGSVTRQGEIVHQTRYGIDLSTESLLKSSIYHSIADYIHEHRKENLSGNIGVGVFGHVDFEQGDWLGTMRLPGMEMIRFREDLKLRYGMNVALDNDVHTAALAELHLGKGREYRHFLYVNVGTGVAAGIISDGRLIRGASNYAGEVGHIFVGRDMEQCMCGSSWCLESAASGGGMINRVIRWISEYPNSRLLPLVKSGEITTADIFKAARQGDSLATKIHKEFIWSLGIGLVNLVNILNPEAIIMGGGVMRDGWLLKELSSFIYQNTTGVSRRGLKEITVTELGPQVAGLLGAACLAWDYEKTG
ncbi:ROK family protein [Paenibacillus aceti]|uniref:Sugar kinase n=1 Tax=Paenibacillus aceti TaxID=1820010 RepID=A0ABQ1VNP2_9BACL|nr:ROK family protein [Paenibacillus aceti]GGF84861.1 sugar kinase [Paenibacillus aceti]